MNLWNAILTIVPAVVLGWFNAWLTPLQGTGVAHLKWESEANSLAAISATVLVLILYVFSKPLNRKGSFVAFGLLVIVLLVGSFWLYTIIADTISATQKDEVLRLQSLWKHVYVGVCVSMLATIFLGFKLALDR